MPSMKGKTVFITGASRGIGLAIAERVAADGANVVVAAKTERPHPKLPGTIHTAAEAVRSAGGQALPVVMDIRFEDQVEAAVDRAVDAFDGIDALVNNASAISLTGTRETSMKAFDLMFDVNVRGTFCATRACLPHLERSPNPHVLMLAPEPRLEPTWFAPHVAYTMSKYGMSLCVLGMAREFASSGIAVNALWPRTVIATAALRRLPDIEPAECRRPQIVADAAHWILTRESGTVSGRFLTDEEVLTEAGVTDFDTYRVAPEGALRTDLFIDE